MIESKLGLREWLAKSENTSVEWADTLIKGLATFNEHDGDCTSQPQSCSLCVLETLLEEYFQYFRE